MAEALKIKEILDEWIGCWWDDEACDRVGKSGERWHINRRNQSYYSTCDCVGFQDFDQFSDEGLKQKALETWKRLFNEEELRRLLNKLEHCADVEGILTPTLKAFLKLRIGIYRAVISKIAKKRKKT